MDDFSFGSTNVMQPRNHKTQLMIQHQRLGHPSVSYMKHLFSKMIFNLDISEFSCPTCILAKSHRVSYPANSNKSSIPFALIHSDVWEPTPCSDNSGFRWFVIFIDDCTRMTWLYLMKHKHEVFNIFQSFHAMVKTQYSKTLKILHSDNGGEYVNHEFQQYFRTHGLQHETSCSQTPQ